MKNSAFDIETKVRIMVQFVSMPQQFLALDFETANYQSDSACSIGLVRVEGKKVVAKEHFLIRPPSRNFVFSSIHGIRWEHVENSPTFETLWPKLKPYFKDIDFIAAHNVGFDKRVLLACCAKYGILPPEGPYTCTVRLARHVLKIIPANLPSVCKALKIELKHHDALSDALACAQIVMAAHA